MLRRPHAAHRTREFVRGSLAAVPFAPGKPSMTRLALTWLLPVQHVTPPKLRVESVRLPCQTLGQKLSGLCCTGGEALQVGTTAAQTAAEEARSGKWLRELEGGGPLRALAPGMERGAFGAWAIHDGEGQDHSENTCTGGCEQPWVGSNVCDVHISYLIGCSDQAVSG